MQFNLNLKEESTDMQYLPYLPYLSEDDPELKQLIRDESDRLEHTLNLIAAENHSPLSVLEVMGSVLNTKTIEGYPGKRFHPFPDGKDHSASW